MSYIPSLLSFHNLTKTVESRILFDNISGAILQNDRIGLIGDNGAGKTTFLNTISLLKDNISYVKQIININSDLNLYQYISSKLENWWDVIEFINSNFKLNFDAEKLILNLSGGELVILELAIAFNTQNEIILLDEPTNHLDSFSKDVLINLINSNSKAFVIASHDSDFLNKIANKIWELENSELIEFTGKFEDYLEYKENLRISKQEKYSSLTKKVNKLQTSLQSTNVVSDRKMARVNRMLKSGTSGIPKIMLKGMKTSGQSSASTLNTKLRKQIQQTSQEASKYKEKQIKSKFFEFKNVNKKGNIIDITNAILKVENKVLVEQIDFRINHGEKIVINGRNGSGKTSFAKSLLCDSHFKIKGVIKNTEFTAYYLDQKYSIVQKNKSLIDNIISFNKNINYEDARKYLSNLGFHTDLDVIKIADVLSGGETARLAFAMILSSQYDLIILDEPTNNIDISTKNTLLENLKNYSGSVILICHDSNFVEELNPDRVYEIKDKKLFNRDFSLN